MFSTVHLFAHLHRCISLHDCPGPSLCATSPVQLFARSTSPSVILLHDCPGPFLCATSPVHLFARSTPHPVILLHGCPGESLFTSAPEHFVARLHRCNPLCTTASVWLFAQLRRCNSAQLRWCISLHTCIGPFLCTTARCISLYNCTEVSLCETAPVHLFAVTEKEGNTCQSRRFALSKLFYLKNATNFYDPKQKLDLRILGLS